ncbi:MAG TPA: DUF2059 domain-containing protein [Allosphingosinicella sp.]|nr:DUF2059 domain-containing protein [Allosphingosinicella sp.]
MRPAILAALLLGLPLPAIASQAPPPAQSPRSSAPAPGIPDPARLAAAARVVDLMMPPGSMRQLMSDFVPDMDMVLAQTAAQLGIDTQGMSPEERARAVEARGAQRDRHFRERLRITMDVSQRVMTDIMAELEPDMRRIMVTMMARQFDRAELGELLAFMTTPTGGKYARLALTMGRDPAWQEMMTLMIPRMAGAATRVEAAVRDATAHLDPPPRI